MLAIILTDGCNWAAHFLNHRLGTLWRYHALHHGPLHRVLVSPAYHRLHHDEADRRGVNLGTVFVLWDLLARLAVFPAKDAVPVATGLRGRPFAVEQSNDAGGCFGVLARQLAEPFRRRNPSTSIEVAR